MYLNSTLTLTQHDVCGLSHLQLTTSKTEFPPEFEPVTPTPLPLILPLICHAHSDPAWPAFPYPSKHWVDEVFRLKDNTFLLSDCLLG